ncbi:flagellar hook-associated protein FlgK [Pontibacterium sp. N1Y112]|uniref:Flagellar hook-associated protein 1 n=1 Tax=Pontibacterium sinense TaxID=2781979 RepID=A0A8J7FA85_9GAMM|nr:flagellar hook-associated protein FlgK [Pontibacterium sinense]MBE9397825.1 flagellar hook-associated protein FlgK [Pontibacterium sinense]
MSNLLHIGSQSLASNSYALNIVGQNIANVNTPGYSQQSVNFSSQAAFGGSSTSVERITSEYLTQQVWSDQAVYSQADSYASKMAGLDNLLAADGSNLSKAMDRYFSALQNVVDDPTSAPNRELMVAELESLANSFNDMDRQLQDQQAMIDSQLSSSAEQVNQLAEGIASLNSAIQQADALGKPDFELQDQRDQMIGELAQQMDLNVVEQGSSGYSLYLDNGQPLVVGSHAATISTTMSDSNPTQTALQINFNGQQSDLNGGSIGGKVGGLLEYRESLNTAQNEVDLMALTFADSMNQQQLAGMDLNSEMGSALFSDINSHALMSGRINASLDNNGSLNRSWVEITDANALTGAEYTLDITGSEAFSLTDASSGQQIKSSALSQVASVADLTDGSYYADWDSGELVVAVEGMQIHLEASSRFMLSDSFNIDPAHDAAAAMELILTDGSKLALASPVRISPAADNSGTLSVTVTVTDPLATTFTSPPHALSPPVDVVFSNSEPPTYNIYDVSDPSNPVPLELNGSPLTDQVYSSGEAIQLNGFSIRLTGQASPGDRFSFSYNDGGVSDNRNVLALSAMQSESQMHGVSWQSAYASMIERVGTDTQSAQLHSQASLSVLKSSEEAKASLSGVNLDEEAAKLVQYQQAYQASAQLISTSQTLFQTLLDAV